MKFKAILIDFDNTIIGSEKYNHAIFLEEMSKLAGRQLTMEDSKHFAGHTWKGIFQILSEKFISNMAPEDIRKVFVDAKTEYFRSNSAPVAWGLDQILALDIKKGIVTGSSRPEVDMFAHLMDLSKFDLIASDELYDRGKPAPDGYLYAIEKFGVEPSDCICIEDSVIGIQSAKAAGCKTVFTREFSDDDHSGIADYTINRLGDIISLLN